MSTRGSLAITTSSEFEELGELGVSTTLFVGIKGKVAFSGLCGGFEGKRHEDWSPLGIEGRW